MNFKHTEYGGKGWHAPPVLQNKHTALPKHLKEYHVEEFTGVACVFSTVHRAVP